MLIQLAVSDQLKPTLQPRGSVPGSSPHYHITSLSNLSKYVLIIGCTWSGRSGPTHLSARVLFTTPAPDDLMWRRLKDNTGESRRGEPSNYTHTHTHTTPHTPGTLFRFRLRLQNKTNLSFWCDNSSYMWFMFLCIYLCVYVCVYL